MHHIAGLKNLMYMISQDAGAVVLLVALGLTVCYIMLWAWGPDLKRWRKGR